MLRSIFVFLVMTAALTSCAQQKKRGSQVTEQIVPSSPAPAEVLKAETMASCNGRGLAWVPAPAPARCAGKLASFSCCRAEVVARYPRLTTQINQFLDKYSDMQLYNCEAAEPKLLRIYVYKKDELGAVEYKNLDLLDYESVVAGPAGCTATPSP